MLKSLEIAGFKSFAKKTSLEFKSKITAIVGPNGSGKSNIAEAFRFALGEQSMKSMRGKKGEDLIWNGSTEIPKSIRASTKLTFDNSQKKFDIDFDELNIERMVARDGLNEYKLNSSDVRLKDVSEKLAQAHIGATGHHIISQGEADRILRASIKERREMIEDALGLKVFLYKKNESERKLKKTRENMREVELLRKEIAPHLRFLRKQVEKAEKAEEITNKLVILYREYLKRESIYIQHKKVAITEQKKPLIEDLKNLEEFMEKARDALALSSSKDNKSIALLDIEKTLKNLHEKKERITREVGKIEGEISANTKHLENLSRNSATESGSVPISELEKTLKDIEGEVWKTENLGAVTEIKLIIIGISEKIKNLVLRYKNEQNVEGKNKFEEINKQLFIKKDETEKELTNINLELGRQTLDYKNIQIEIDKEKDSSRQVEREIFKISAEQTETRNKLERTEIEEKELSKEEENWKQEAVGANTLFGAKILGFEKDDLNIDNEQIVKEERKLQEDRKRELERMRIRLEETGVAGGTEILKEYKDTEERDLFLAKELNDLEQSTTSLNNLIQDLEEKVNQEFKSGIEKINKSFKEFFSLMFDGGDAELRVITEEKRKNKQINDEEVDIDVDEAPQEGVEIQVSLPRKRIRNLDMLSGGERALTSIALIFAMSQVNPPPFIILDETDAALDEANSKRYGDMIEELSKYSQLILITHNRETMSRAGIIYGVTMGKDGISRLLSIAFDEAVEVAK